MDEAVDEQEALGSCRLWMAASPVPVQPQPFSRFLFQGWLDWISVPAETEALRLPIWHMLRMGFAMGWYRVAGAVSSITAHGQCRWDS